jgi:hypothetical protein
LYTAPPYLVPLGALLSLSLSTVATAGPDRPATDLAPLTCVNVDQEYKVNGVAVTVANQCTMGVRCSIAWSLACGSGTTKSTHPVKKQLSVAANGHAAVEASAASCSDQSWEISDLTYDCAPAP